MDFEEGRGRTPIGTYVASDHRPYIYGWRHCYLPLRRDWYNQVMIHGFGSYFWINIDEGAVSLFPEAS